MSYGQQYGQQSAAQEADRAGISSGVPTSVSIAPQDTVSHKYVSDIGDDAAGQPRSDNMIHQSGAHDSSRALSDKFPMSGNSGYSSTTGGQYDNYSSSGMGSGGQQYDDNSYSGMGSGVGSGMGSGLASGAGTGVATGETTGVFHKKHGFGDGGYDTQQPHGSAGTGYEGQTLQSSAYTGDVAPGPHTTGLTGTGSNVPGGVGQHDRSTLDQKLGGSNTGGNFDGTTGKMSGGEGLLHQGTANNANTLDTTRTDGQAAQHVHGAIGQSAHDDLDSRAAASGTSAHNEGGAQKEGFLSKVKHALGGK